MIFNFSARRNSSFFTKFSSALLLRLSFSICSLRTLTYWSLISLFLAMSFSRLLNSFASLTFSFKIFWIYWIFPSSTILFLRYSSKICLNYWIASSFFCLTWLFPSICFCFSFKNPSNLRIVASSAILLFLSF